MRIGLLIYGDINTLSGGYLYNRELIAYLRAQDDEVEIYRFPPTGFWRRIGDNFRPSLLNRLIDADIDVLIEDELVHPSLFWSTGRRRGRSRFPVVALVHLLAAFDRHSWLRARAHRMMERRYLRAVDGLILNSRSTLEQVQSLLGGVLPPHAVAVPAGNNFPRTSRDGSGMLPSREREAPLKILFVGNVIRRKGLHVLLQALGGVDSRDFRLTVAGRLDMEPAYVDSVRRRIAGHGLQDRVSVAGPVTGDDLANLYHSHDLMVLPSAYEGYGIVYVEAQQFGLPVVGTTAGAAKEIIRHGENGYLIDPGDHSALAEILRSLHRDRTLLGTLGDNARHAFAKHPTWADTGAAIRRFLVDLTALRAERT